MLLECHELIQRGVNSLGYVYRGTPSDQIAKRLKDTKSDEVPTHVLIQSGDIDIRTKSLADASRDQAKLIDSVLQVYPQSRILVTSIPNTVRNRFTYHKINRFNENIANKCRRHPEISIIDCSNMKLKDSIHLTDLSKDQLSRKAINSMLYI